MRQLERTSDNKKAGIIQNKGDTGDIVSRLGHDNYVKFSGEQRTPENRVTFDLANAANGTRKTKVVEVAPAKLNTAAVVDIAKKSQLPSDAKQRLQEMAGYDVKRNYRKSSSGEHQLRPTRLSLNGGTQGKYTVSPPSSPVKVQAPDLVSHKFQSPAQELTSHRRPSSSSLSRNNSRNSGINSAKTSLMQTNNSMVNNNNNNNRSKQSGRESQQSRLIVSSSPGTGHHNPGTGVQQRTRTPSVERSLSSIKEDSSKVRGARSFWGGWWKF